MLLVDCLCVCLYSMLASTWVTWSYLNCLWLHPTTSPTGNVCVRVWCVVCVCVHVRAFIVPLCAAVTVISHQSEAAEPHIDIPDCLPACLSDKNRYVKRQALSPPFFPRIVCLSWWIEKKKRKVSGLCQLGWGSGSVCGGEWHITV